MAEFRGVRLVEMQQVGGGGWGKVGKFFKKHGGTLLVAIGGLLLGKSIHDRIPSGYSGPRPGERHIF